MPKSSARTPLAQIAKAKGRGSLQRRKQAGSSDSFSVIVQPDELWIADPDARSVKLMTNAIIIGLTMKISRPSKSGRTNPQPTIILRGV